MLVAIYARVSTQRQENEETIETQIMAIKDFCVKNGHTIVKEYRDDGWSGMILARPALDELRMDTKKKLWEAVVIYDPDRLARKYSYQELIGDELTETGIKVLYVTTPPLRDEGDKLLYGVKGLFAEYERAKITERFRLGKLRKAREGNVVTSQGPYGYIYVKGDDKNDGHYLVNPDEVDVARQIFEWVGYEGLTIRKVVKRLQERQIRPRKSARGVWNTSTITTMLRNETYIGKAHFNKSYAVVPKNPIKTEKYKRISKTSRKCRDRKDWIVISVPAIIDEELFGLVRKRLRDNYELCKRNRKNEYLLAGKIYCVCGRKRCGEGPQRGKHLYYRCNDRSYAFPLPSKCKEKGINARIADKLVWRKIGKLMTNRDLMKRQVSRWGQVRRKEVDVYGGKIERLSEELGKLEKEEQRYIKAYGSEMISLGQLEEVARDLRVKKESMKQQIALAERETAKEQINIPTESEIDRFCDEAVKTLPTLSFESRYSIVHSVTGKITGTQSELRVDGYIPIGGLNHVKFKTISRDSRFAERREKHLV